MNELDRAFTGSIPELYDRYMGPMLFEPYALDMAARFAGFEGALLETAAGTGRVTRALAQAAPRARITATDLSAEMLGRAQQVVRAPNVQWRQADAQSLPFDSGGFDAVVCQFGVMFFPDKAAGYAEARRVLKPSGQYVFSVWDDLQANDISRIVHETMAAVFPDDPPSFLARGPFGYHDQDAIRRGLANAGFGDVRIETVVLETPAASAVDAARALGMGSPMRNDIDTRHPGRLEDVVQALTEALLRQFGEGPVAGRGQALVITATP